MRLTDTAAAHLPSWSLGNNDQLPFTAVPHPATCWIIAAQGQLLEPADKLASEKRLRALAEEVGAALGGAAGSHRRWAWRAAGCSDPGRSAGASADCWDSRRPSQSHGPQGQSTVVPDGIRHRPPAPRASSA